MTPWWVCGTGLICFVVGYLVGFRDALSICRKQLQELGKLL